MIAPNDSRPSEKENTFVHSGIKIGTCGFRRSKYDYVKQLSCVEIQHTFYQPPMVKTLERWRAEMPADFEFTIKAWQMITHEGSSPTYKRIKKKLTEKRSAEAGSFKPTESVDEGWEITLASAKALNARTILFQCPAKFRQTDENISNMRQFFKKIDRGEINFAWEPRGDSWEDKVIKKICKDLDLWHCVDPFDKRTVTPENCYYRLHGRTGWRYKYETVELEELRYLLPADRLGYVFFNNIYMTEDAVAFQKILDEAE